MLSKLFKTLTKISDSIFYFLARFFASLFTFLDKAMPHVTIAVVIYCIGKTLLGTSFWDLTVSSGQVISLRIYLLLVAFGLVTAICEYNRKFTKKRLISNWSLLVLMCLGFFYLEFFQRDTFAILIGTQLIACSFVTESAFKSRKKKSNN